MGGPVSPGRGNRQPARDQPIGRVAKLITGPSVVPVALVATIRYR